VAGFGENLRQAREARKITLQEIAETTKIGTRALQALENEQFDQLPGGIFNKGFVRAYARFVGLDEEKTVAAYMAAANVQAPETDMQEMSNQVAIARSMRAKPGMSAASIAGVVALIVALAVGAVWLREERKEAKRTAPVASAPVVVASPPTAVAPSVTPSPAPDATTNTTQTAAPNAAPNVDQSAAPAATPKAGQGAAAKPDASTDQSGEQGKPANGTGPAASKVGAAGKAAPVEISISATERSWISVRSDGKAVESVTLNPEDPEMRSRSYKATEKLMLVLGNPAGVKVTYNGKPTGTLGVAGQRAILTFTPKGMEKQ
jgi:cytoskeleton protein RodZ